MKHAFFKNVDFKEFLNKKITPEWKPVLKDKYDVNNFDKEFTNMGNLEKKLIKEAQDTII